MRRPHPFFEVRVNQFDLTPRLLGLCVGYEQGRWRYEGLVNHLMEWMPEFCLTHDELEKLDSSNMVSLMREAVRKLYTSGKFERRGEFGELILHAAIRQVFGSLPAISKIYYKSAANNTVKGFDAVHVVPTESDLELWLGEVKFYKDINSAISDVILELNEHLDKDYLRDEFLLIKGKVNDTLPYADELKKLLNPNTSLDTVFQRVVLPVLLTYESSTVSNFNECSHEYQAAFHKEMIKNHDKFNAKNPPKEVVINLFLMPLKSKKKLVSKLDEKLKIWQSI